MNWPVIISKVALGSLSLLLLFVAGARLHWDIVDSANEPAPAEIRAAALQGFALLIIGVGCLFWALAKRGYPLLDCLIAMAAFIALSMHFIFSGI
jgi:hypothetical protein